MDLFQLIRKNLTPLQKLENAVKNNDVKLLEEVLSDGVDPDTTLTKYGGDTALHFAARAGYFRCIQLLILHGANPDKLNDFHISPLFDAVRFNHERATLELLRHVNEVKSMEDLWLWDSNMPKYFSGLLSDELITILIKATPCCDKTRENLRNNVFSICLSRGLFKSLKYWLYCGNSIDGEQESNLDELLQADVAQLDTEIEQTKSEFREWLGNRWKNASSLQYYGCLSIRRSFYGKCNVFRGVANLPLPETLKRDICFS